MTMFETSMWGEERPVARLSDPETSHEAAASVNVRKSQSEVWALFVAEGGSLTDEQLIAAAEHHGIKQSPSGLRTRRKELCAKGLLRDSGERELTASRRSTIVWSVA